MKRMTEVTALPKHRLSVQFDDGVSGIVDLSTELVGPVLGPLQDEALFSQVRLDEFGAPCWPNGADVAPDAIYAELTGHPLATNSPKTKPHLPDHHKPI